jgi:hypothetical protein
MFSVRSVLGWGKKLFQSPSSLLSRKLGASVSIILKNCKYVNRPNIKTRLKIRNFQLQKDKKNALKYGQKIRVMEFV